jgi:hypothetical protein
MKEAQKNKNNVKSIGSWDILDESEIVHIVGNIIQMC